MHALTRRHLVRSVLATAVLAGAAGAALAEDPEGDGGDFDLSWYTVDGGGGISIDGELQLLGSIGQHDAGPPSTGGDWSVSGGFLAGGAEVPPPPCPNDIDGSGAVDFGDLLAVLSNFGVCAGCPEDLDGNGEVDFGDLLAVLSAFGPCP